MLPLEAVIITPELSRRPLRERDLAAEHLAVTELIEEMAIVADKPGSERILQRLVDTACRLCRADSAGISMLEMQGDEEIFRWHAIAGRWAHLTGGTVGRNLSACGIVVRTNAPVLMERPERHYGLLPGPEPIAEMLMIPFHFEGRPVGTLWVASLGENGRRFDAEDLRLLTSLGRLASHEAVVLVGVVTAVHRTG